MRAGTADLLVVAGEQSGDDMASAVLGRLPTRAFGIGGSALREAGLEIVADVRAAGVMGVPAVSRRLAMLARIGRRLLHRARNAPPRAALLVGFSTFNAALGARLRRMGVPVLWYSPPQVWAWRWDRSRRLRSAADHFAVTLPFEESLWRQAGACAEFVGHPALERVPPPEGAPPPNRLALLPGSRDQEVTLHLPILLAAARRLQGSLEASVLLSPSLGSRTERWVRRTAEAASVHLETARAAGRLRNYTFAIAVSGTATLECAAAGVPPIIVYRADRLTALAARAVVKTPFIGLPNIVLGYDAFPELIQDAVTPERIEAAVRRVAEQRTSALACCAEVRQRLHLAGPPPSERVAARLKAWLGDPAAEPPP